MACESKTEHQRALLDTPVGVPGSGYTRYAAAMFLYNEAGMSAEMLEIYRRCCKLDHEDPLDLAAHEGVAIPTK